MRSSPKRDEPMRTRYSVMGARRAATVSTRLMIGEPKAMRSSSRWRVSTLSDAPKKASAA
ncbi:hypothetical protein D3C72_2543610 [compost metagenome]